MLRALEDRTYVPPARQTLDPVTVTALVLDASAADTVADLFATHEARGLR